MMSSRCLVGFFIHPPPPSSPSEPWVVVVVLDSVGGFDDEEALSPSISRGTLLATLVKVRGSFLLSVVVVVVIVVVVGRMEEDCGVSSMMR